MDNFTERLGGDAESVKHRSGYRHLKHFRNKAQLGQFKKIK